MIDKERKDGMGAYRHYRKRHSGHLAVLAAALYMVPAFFLTGMVGELTDAMYFQEIPVHSLEVPALPAVCGYMASFVLFGAFAMRCLNPDCGKLTLRKILALGLGLALGVCVLLGGLTLAVNMAECYTEEGIMAVNREEILVYTWEDVKECRIEPEGDSRIMRLVMADGEEYVYGEGRGLDVVSDGFNARFPEEREDYMKFVQRQLSA